MRAFVIRANSVQNSDVLICVCPIVCSPSVSLCPMRSATIFDFRLKDFWNLPDCLRDANCEGVSQYDELVCEGVSQVQMSSLIQAVKGAPPLRTFVPVDVLINFSFYLPFLMATVS